MTELFSGYDKSTQKLVFRVYAEQLPETEKRQRHKDAHFAALDLLGAALAEDFGLRHAVIRRVGLGKPQLIHGFLHINISHCKGLAVAAAGTVPLGVDAEVPRTVRESLLRKVCTAEEIAQIQAADDEKHMFARFWTLKEAYAKYTGEGIGLDFAKLGFAFSGDGALMFRSPAAERVQFFHILTADMIPVSLCCQNDITLNTDSPDGGRLLRSRNDDTVSL